MGILIYIFVFTVSCGLLACVESGKLKKNISRLLEITAIVLPILLAGLRDYTIGTDVSVYVLSVYNSAKTSASLLQFLAQSDIEIGFALLVYFAEKVFGSVAFVLMEIHTVIICFVYFSIRNYRKNISVWLAMLVFYLQYYNMSLNIMRQWMAMAILLYGSKYLFAHKLTPYLMCIGIAAFFHSTAYIGIVPYIIYEYLNARNRLVFRVGELRLRGNKLRHWMIIIAVTVVFFTSLDLLGQILVKLRLYKYVVYLRGGIVSSNNQLILRMPLLCLLLVNRKNFIQNREATFLICMLAFDILLSQLAAGGNQSWRIALFFGQYNIISYPIACQTGKGKMEKNIFVVCTIAFLTVYWLYNYVLMGSHDTIPYRFF